MTEELLRQRKEGILKMIQAPSYVPMKLKELAALLDLPRERREELKEVMDALESEGSVALSRRGKYSLPEAPFVTGIFSGTAKGFGFVAAEGQPQDIFIPEEKTGTAMHGDKVRVVVNVSAARAGARTEGEVVRVLERANVTVIGYYQKKKAFGFVVPDNQKLPQDIFIPQ